MESAKQQSILRFFNQTDSAKNTDRNTCESEDVRPSASKLQQTTKRIGADSLTEGTKKRRKGEFVRQYDKKYLEFGFTVAPCTEESPRPLCLVCSQVLSNDAMKPSKLARHFQSKHSNLESKPVEYFQRLLSEMKSQKNHMKKMTTTEKSLLRASYAISFQICKQKKPFSIGANLVKPCILAAAEEVLDAQAVQKLTAIPLSNDIVQQRSLDMAMDVEQQLVEEVKKSKYFAIQLDESTDVSNCAILLCYVRYKGEEDFKEELFCCISLPSKTTGSEIFRSLNEYFYEHGIDWENCVGICTDGAASMTGCRAGVVARIKEVGHKEMLSTHCIIHREHLSAKKLSSELRNVLNITVKIVNEIRSRALNSRLFKLLCESMDSQHQHLLLHAEVRWLSRGRVLSRLFELRKEAKQFLQEANSPLTEFLVDEMWISKLAYLVDIFGRLNELNISLQGFNTNIFTLRNKTDAFKKKLTFWKERVQRGDIEMFPTINECLINVGDDISKQMLILIGEHLNELAVSFQKYFPEEEDPRKGNLWINDPFTEDVNTCNLNLSEKERLIELSSDTTLLSRYKKETLSHFWMSLENEYPSLSHKAIKLLLIFTTTYLCEKSFSSLSLIKTKKRNRLNVSAALRLSETSLQPRLSRILATKQQQISH